MVVRKEVRNPTENEIPAFHFVIKAPHHHDVSGNGGEAPRIINLGTTWKILLNFTVWLLFMGRNPYLFGWKAETGHGHEEGSS
jgi:hypothetical protein